MFDDSLFNALGFASGPTIANMFKNWHPSELDVELIEIRKQEVGFRIQELEMREQQFLMQIAENRKNLLLNIEEQDLLKRWPLNLSPTSFLRTSAGRDSCALNIIICIVDTNDEKFLLEQGQAINQTINMINNHSLPIAERAAELFGNDMLCYREVLKKSKLTGDSLCTTLSTSLGSEPTVLIELRVPYPDQVSFHISHWGMRSDTNTSFTKYKTQALPLSPLPALPEENDVHGKMAWKQQFQHIFLKRSVTVGLALSGLIASIGDAFRILQRPHTLPVPVLPLMMDDPSFGVLPEGSKVPEEMWKPIRNVYLSVYDGVAILDKLLASELASKAANMAYEAKQLDFTNQLLDKAIQLHPANLSADKANIIGILHRHRADNKPSELETALRKIRGYAAEETSGKNLEELWRQYLGPSKKC